MAKQLEIVNQVRLLARYIEGFHPCCLGSETRLDKSIIEISTSESYFRAVLPSWFHCSFGLLTFC